MPSFPDYLYTESTAQVNGNILLFGHKPKYQTIQMLDEAASNRIIMQCILKETTAKWWFELIKH